MALLVEYYYILCQFYCICGKVKIYDDNTSRFHNIITSVEGKVSMFSWLKKKTLASILK